jgi:hypothetical protein
MSSNPGKLLRALEEARTDLLRLEINPGDDLSELINRCECVLQLHRLLGSRYSEGGH